MIKQKGLYREMLHFMRVFLFAVLWICFISESAKAGTVRPQYANKWITKKGSCYHYDSKGKKQTGLVTIGNKTYLFNKKGAQQVGWRKIKSSYYYFQIGKKGKGFMVKKTKINGIKLDKNGKAVLKTPYARRKVKLLVRYQKWLEELTSPSMSKKEKLLNCFDFLRKKLLYKAGHEFEDYAPYLDISGAEYVIDNGRFFECYSIASAFAYLANAIGYRNIKVCAHNLGGGHGWVEIDGIIYDPSLARHVPDSYRFFATTDRDGQEAPAEYVYVI